MDRKQEIIDAATKSFSLFGYKATTMDQVAKIANVGKGTIYTFFDNKEVLFQEIVIRMITEMKQEATIVMIEGNIFSRKCTCGIDENVRISRNTSIICENYY